VALSSLELEPGGTDDAGIVIAPKGPVRDSAESRLEVTLLEAARRVDTRPEPTLRPKPGGGYTFAGHGFVATIENDGSVHMTDRFRHSSWTFRPTHGKAGEDKEGGEPAGFRFFETAFDIFKRMDRNHGNDPFQSERRWFLDRTRALRESMAARYLDRRVHSRQREP
jgi:hypothetical protein